MFQLDNYGWFEASMRFILSEPEEPMPFVRMRSTLQNSQCAIGYSVANFSGNTANVTVQVVFKSPAFSGTKTVYVGAFNSWGSSTFGPQGTWTVP